MRSCEAPADTFSRESASAMKPGNKKKTFLVSLDEEGNICPGPPRSSITQVLQDDLPFLSDFSTGVSHGLDVDTQSAIALNKKRAQPRLHVQEGVRDALAGGSAGTGSSLQPHTENNETSETLAGSIMKKTHIYRASASEDSHNTIM
ncbi:hypothetical protein EYF80_003800 [Liparis tanakae]|uniref:Uncharacterized protein n=1 Tax=Liparis tanakae TaxID=230148 RepID=A0A4Z2J6Y7_9TELE|nr:hypothetical protein EYF80_003800 [Liparis tanakae]